MSERIMSYLPEFYREIKEIAELAKTESVELDDLTAAVQRLFDDQFIMTASVEAIRRREQMLGIQADPQTESLDFRRRRLVNRYSFKPPFTERYLQQRLDLLFGPGRGKVDVDIQNFIVRLYASIVDAAIFNEAEKTIERIKPANMVYLASPWGRETIEITDRVIVAQRRYHKVYEFRVGMKPMKYQSEVTV